MRQQINTGVRMQRHCEKPKWLREDFKHKLGRWDTSHLGGDDTELNEVVRPQFGAESVLIR